MQSQVKQRFRSLMFNMYYNVSLLAGLTESCLANGTCTDTESCHSLCLRDHKSWNAAMRKGIQKSDIQKRAPELIRMDASPY